MSETDIATEVTEEREEVMYEPDMHQVDDLIYVGGDMHPWMHEALGQFRGLVHHGVKAVIDCRQEHNDIHLGESVGLEYHWVPTDDHGGKLEESWWASIIEYGRMHAGAQEPMFIHCHMGVNRGPSAAFAIMVSCLGYEPIKAYDMIRSARPQAHVIYAPQFTELYCTPAQHEAFKAHYEAMSNFEELCATIGRIRTAARSDIAHYKIPLVEILPN